MNRQKSVYLPNIRQLNLIHKTMSGGKWDYIQYRFTDIVDDIKSEIEKSGKPKTKEEMKAESWYDPDWYEKYPEDKFHYKYPDKVITEFKKAIHIIEMAHTYIHRIDWLLCGDDGDETFIERLEDARRKDTSQAD